MLFPGSDRHTHLHTLTHKIKGERREKSWGREREHQCTENPQDKLNSNWLEMGTFEEEGAGLSCGI